MKAPTRAHTMESISLQDAERSRIVYGEHCLEGVVVIDHVGNAGRACRGGPKTSSTRTCLSVDGFTVLIVLTCRPCLITRFAPVLKTCSGEQ
jgi:hypothetical protein